MLAIDISDDGRYVLYRIMDVEDGEQLPTPFAVLDRQTGDHELVSIMRTAHPSSSWAKRCCRPTAAPWPSRVE